MKRAIVLLALLVVAAAAQADKPDSPPGQGNAQGKADAPGQQEGGPSQSQGGQSPPAEAASPPASDEGPQAAPQGTSSPSTPGSDTAQGSPGEPASDAPPQAEQPAGPGASGDTASRGRASDPGAAPANQGSAIAGPISADAPALDPAPEQPGASAPSVPGPTGPPAVPPGAARAAASPPATQGPLAVTYADHGNVLAWTLPDPTARQVQVWRLDDGAWTPVAVTAGDGQLFDSAGSPSSQYLLTWSEEPLAGAGLASVAVGLPLVPGHADASTLLGRWLVLLLWAGIGAFGLVRGGAAPRMLDERVDDGSQLLPALASLPGIDGAALERVVALGLRTVGDLRRLDPQALAFWAGVPQATVRQWHQAVELLQWPSLPPGAAQRLALVGQASMAQLARAAPADLFAALRSGASLAGPGLPADEAEVTSWIVEARQAVGLTPVVPRSSASAVVS